MDTPKPAPEPPDDALTPDEERKKSLLERVMPLSEMLYRRSAESEPLLGPFVRRGMPTIIGAYGGHGKSTTAMEMIKAIVLGTPFLGYVGRGDGAKAMIIDLEQGISVAQQQVFKSFYPEKYEPGETIPDILEAMEIELGEHMDRVIHADWQEGVDLSNPGPDLEVMEQMIETHRPDVVLIDPVYKLFMGSDTNENVVIGSFIKQIDRLRKKYGFALILPMHPRKEPTNGSGKMTMHDLYGSAIWSWWAVVVLMLRRKDEGKTTEMHFEKDRTATLPVFKAWDLNYSPLAGYSRKPGDDMQEGVPKMSLDEKIWRLLQQAAPKMMTRAGIRAALNHPNEKTIEKATKRIEEANEERGAYRGLVIRRGKPNLYGYERPGDDPLAKLAEEFKVVEAETWTDEG